MTTPETPAVCPKMFPLQRDHDKKIPSGPSKIAWTVAEKAYEEYARRYGTSQSLERLAERGGFSWGEMDMLYPLWREESDKVLQLEQQLAAAREECERLKQENDDYKIGIQRNTNRLTEFANSLGLEGTMFQHYGFSQFGKQLASRSSQLQEARGFLSDAARQLRCLGMESLPKSINAYLARLDKEQG